MNSLLIHKNLTGFLQTLRDTVNHGYHYWTSGVIKTIKADQLCEKFHEKYQVLASRQKRDYHRRLKKANAYLFMYPQKGEDVMDWILVVTQGNGIVHTKEQLKNHFSGQHRDRITFRHYELIKINQRLTWRLKKAEAEMWEKKMVSAARKNDTTDFALTSKALTQFPMFSGIRKQIKHIFTKANKTRDRYHLGSFPMPSFPILKRMKVYDDPPKTLGFIIDRYKTRLTQTHDTYE